MKARFAPLYCMALCLIGGAAGLDAAMTPEQADKIVAKAGTFPPPSYLSPEEASGIFDFRGKLKIEEDVHFGNQVDVSHLLIKPDDGSFDYITVAISDGGILEKNDEAYWGGSGVRSHLLVQMPNGAKGVCDGTSIAVTSPDQRFDVCIELTVQENGRDPTEITASNRRMVNATENARDHGRKYMIEVMKRIYPLAEKQYDAQMKARIQVAAAAAILKKYADDQRETRFTWTVLNMNNLVLNLQDPVNARWFLFHSSGSVSVTSEIKHSYVTAPVYLWRLEDDWLVISGKKPLCRLKLVGILGDIIVAEDGSGAKEMYKWSRNGPVPHKSKAN